MKIVFTGGGTGGHIFPIIALVRELKKISKQDLEFFYLGPKDNFAELLFSLEGIKIKNILAGKIRRYSTPKSILENIIDIFKIPLGFFQSLFYLFLLYPDLIFSKGGYGSFPVVLAGWILRVPIFLHESDVLPGLTNKISAKLAFEIFASFPNTYGLPQNKTVFVGNPIRIEILNGNKEKGREYFKIKSQKNVILVLGGSQGAQRINEKILNILNELLENFEVIHQVGEKNFKEFENITKLILKKELRQFYHPYPFLKEEELKNAFAVADLVIARAGAGSIFEIAACGKPSILIPLPESAQEHQLKNAYTYAKTGAAIVLEEENFTPHFFLEKIKTLFSQPEKLKEMASQAKDFAKPEAAKVVAHYLYTFLTQ